MRPRFRGWMHRAMALALVTGMVLPASVSGTLAATYDPTAGDGQTVSKQATGGSGREKSFEELSAEDLFSQPIYEVVKADWDKQYKPVTGVRVDIPAASYTANGG